MKLVLLAFNIVADPTCRSARVAATVSSTRSTSLGGTNSYQSSRRSSEDSLEEGISLRDVRVSAVFCWECSSSGSDVIFPTHQWYSLKATRIITT
jgi:hypothetical protein